MSQIIKKFIGDNQVGAAKILLENNSALRSRNAANSADINMFLVDASDVINVMGSMIPSTNASFELGSSTKEFSNVHAQLLQAQGGLDIRSATSNIILGPALGVNLVDPSNTIAIPLRFFNAAGTFSAAIQAPALAASYTLTLPPDDGTVGQLLRTDGSGVLTWVTAASGTVTNVATGTGLTGGPITTTGTISLANTAVTPGSYTLTSLTVDAQGRITAASNGTAVTNVATGTGLTGGPITTTGTISLANTAVTPGSYTSANITVDAQGRITAASSGGSSVTNNKETFVLSGTDITNQYIDLAHVARTSSINFMVQGSGSQLEGASYDYSVSYTGGAGGNTRITFLNGLATGGGSALIAGDVVQVQYEF